MNASERRDDLVGRDEELALVEAFLDESGRPVPAAMVLEGEAGIGKTALWRAGLALAEERGYLVLEAAPAGSETELLFAALRDLLDEAFDDVADELPDPQRRALAIALLREEPEGRAPERGNVAAAALSLLRAVARKRPVLVALDDVQWLDAESAAVLEFVARRLRDEPARLFLTRRFEPDATAPLGLDRARVPVTKASLGGLSLGALHAVLREHLGRTYPRPALRRLHEISGGNPFFALEVAHAAGSSVARPEDLPAFDSPDQVVADRLAALSPPAHSTVATVALAATHDVDLIERATSRAGLDEALAAGVLELAKGRVQFVHPLVAGAVLRQLDHRERRSIHRALADLVSDAEERALHLARSADGPDPETVAALEAAATSALQRGAPGRAAQLLEHAIELADDAQVAELKARAGEAHFSGGDPVRARELLEQAVEELPAGPARAGALWRLAIARGELDGAKIEVELLQRALGETGGDLLLETRVLRRLGRTAVFAGDVPLGLRSARRARELAEQLDDPGLLAHALGTMAQVELLARGSFDRALLERAIELEDASGLLPLDDSPTAEYGYLLMKHFEIDQARERFLALLERGLDQGDETNISGAFFYLSVLELLAGNLQAAEQHADEAQELAEQSAGINRVAVLHATAKVRAYRGDVEAAHRLASEAHQLSAKAGEPYFSPAALAIRGFADLSSGKAADAARLLEKARVAAEACGLREVWLTRFKVDLVEALVLLGGLDDARAVLEDFRRSAEESDRQWAHAMVAYGEGLILSAESETDGAAAAFEHSLELLSPYPVPFERARMLLALGSARRRAKEKSAARRALEEAAVLFEQVGTPLWAEKARAELARISGRAPSTGALTPTEQRVAQLVEQGSTNKEVAAALFVSVKTVEAHLSRIYTKLGIRSRSELAHRSAAAEDPKL